MPTAKKVHAAAEKPVVLLAERARQGNIQHRTIRVLIFSTIGAVIALAVATNIGGPFITEGGHSMSNIDIAIAGVVLVAFLGLAGTLFYLSERWSSSQPSTRLEYKQPPLKGRS